MTVPLGPGPDLLFVPGHDRAKQAKAAGFGVGALILDLEDSVAPEAKAGARDTVRQLLTTAQRPAGPCLVRVNSLASGYLLGDLHALAGVLVDAIVVPKVEDPEVVRMVSALLAPQAGVGVYALIETARGVARAGAIANAGGCLRGLMFGHADLANDLGIAIRRPLRGALGHARAAVATAARGAGVAVYDTPYENFRDVEGLRAEAQEALELGYLGKLAIHPAQPPVIQAVWSPTDADVEQARRVIAAFDEAVRAGQAVAVLDGALVERQMAESARRILARAECRTPA